MRKLIIALLLLSPAAFAQNSRVDNVALGPRGPIPGATIAVCTQPAVTTTQPCSPLATLCSSLSDVACIQPNPLTADSLGNYHFYIKQSQNPFTIQIYGPQVASPLVIPDQTVPLGSGTSATLTNVTVKTLNNTFYASQACTVPGTLNETCFNNIITSAACSSGGATNASCKIVVDSGTYTLNNPVTTVPVACAAYPNNSCPVNIECTDRSVTINIVGNHDGFLIGQNSRIANCHIVGDNNGVNTSQKCIDSGNAANVMIEGNFIEKCSGTAINSGGNMTNWTIRDNVIQNGLLEGMLIGTSGGGNTGCTVTGNKVNGNAQNGIDINASRCVVANNSLNNNGTAHVGGNSNNIMLFSSSTVTPVDNNVVSNNTVSGAFERGIDLQCLGGSMQNTTVTGNTSNGNSQDGVRLVYNSGTGTCKGDTILGNSLTNNTVNGLNEVAGGGGTYSGNVLGPNTYIGNGASIAADMTGVQTAGLTQTANIAGCTTAAGALWGACTNTVTWPITYPTTGYKVGCTGNGTGAGVPVLGPISNKVVASINITTYEATAVNAAFTTVECVANQ